MQFDLFCNDFVNELKKREEIQFVSMRWSASDDGISSLLIVIKERRKEGKYVTIRGIKERRIL